MNRDEVEEKVARILSVCLKRGVLPGEAVIRQKEDAWDSLANVEILLSLEEAFDLQLSDEAIQSLTDSRRIVDTVIANGSR